MDRSGLRIAVGLAIALPLLAGCSGNAGRWSSEPPPMQRAPTPPVYSQQLPPPGGPGAVSQAPLDGMSGQAGQESRMASLPPQTETPTRESVLGQWSLIGSGDSCQLFVTLTGWEGGYRASTRGCNSPELTNVGAWNIEGDLVVLKDNQGNAVARLAQAGSSSFSGRLELGGAVTMSR